MTTTQTAFSIHYTNIGRMIEERRFDTFASAARALVEDVELIPWHVETVATISNTSTIAARWTRDGGLIILDVSALLIADFA